MEQKITPKVNIDLLAKERYPQECGASENCDCNWCFEMRIKRRVFVEVYKEQQIIIDQMKGQVERLTETLRLQEALNKRLNEKIKAEETQTDLMSDDVCSVCGESPCFNLNHLSNGLSH